MTEVRSFMLSDVPLLRRLAPLGVSLDTVTGLTRGISPVNDAFLASLPLGDRGMPTYVLRADGRGLLAQLRHREGATHAHIAYIAPNLSDGDDAAMAAWLSLIDGVTAAAGARGAHSVHAEVDPGSAAFVALREAGFAVFARQDLWRRAPAPASPSPARMLQPRTSMHMIGVGTLYANAVPRLVQQAAPPPEADERGLVYVNADRSVAGHITVYEGRLGILLKALLHPEVCDEAAALFADAITYLPHPERAPVYCAVQRYQDWLRGPLAEVGFEPWARQVVMVKYTVRRVQHPAYQPLPALEQAPPVVEMQVAEPTANKR
ncbi:MAG: hypothetical protein M5R40_24970 [Anaerolineae bacterium]|nr:hypothetical protein [Anaerolineae bacterium]